MERITASREAIIEQLIIRPGGPLFEGADHLGRHPVAVNIELRTPSGREYCMGTEELILKETIYVIPVRGVLIM